MNITLPEIQGLDSGGLLSPSVSESQTSRSNALSNKITAVLSSSYADIEIRDALETLDKREIKNDVETRRNLRRDVQKEIIECNGEIVKDFGEVAHQLKSVGEALANLRNTCAAMRKHISVAKTETAPMVEEARTLMQRISQLESKQKILSAFKSHFVLADDENAVLTSGAESVNDTFFLALVKAKRIHKDSQILLGGESQRLGLEILDESSKTLNSAFQKLHRWIQRELKALDFENPRINAGIRRAIRVLAERPTLFQNCLETFAETREETLSNAFHVALTGSGQDQGRKQKPIEFYAHEPVRYVGDMLAWAHSTTVSEREALEGLFIAEGDEIAKGIQEGLESEPWSRSESEEEFDGRKALHQLLNRSLAGVAMQLRQRIEQVVKSHDESVLAYKIANLVVFYKNVFAKLVEEQGFLETLELIEGSALDQFQATMRYHVENVRSEYTAPPLDLSPPEFLNPSLDSLQSLLKSYETSLATAKSVDDSGLLLVLSEALDPFLDLCETLSQTLSPPASHIFAINCLLRAKAALSTFPLTGDKSAELAEAIEEQEAQLIENQHRFLLSASGLQPIIAALSPLSSNNSDDLARIPTLPAFSPDALMAVGRQLDNFLPSALMDVGQRTKGLSNASMAREVTAEAARRFCEDFEGLEEMIVAADDVAENIDEAIVRDGELGHESRRLKIREMFPRTSEDIRVLLN